MEINEKLVKPIEEVKYLNGENADRYRSIIRYFFGNMKVWDIGYIKKMFIIKY